jgi:putative transposase
VIALEDLNLAGMTRSAKGTIGEPGTNVAAEAGLDRSLAEAAPGKLGRWVLVEAEEAGCRAWLVPYPRESPGELRSGADGP